MMNHRQITKLLFGLIIIFVLSCQEETSVSQLRVDQNDVAAAEALVSEFLEENGLKEDAEARGLNAYALTVLACDNDNLYYYTAPSGMQGYELLDEETVTASVHGGGYIFWYGAQGIKFLTGIEFDENSQSILENFPDAWKNSRLWYVQIPEVNDEILKYDIIYQTNKGNGPVRLDPKIRVQ